MRTSVQQQQNKLAQQWYREKRKQKNVELESRVEDLTRQLGSMQQVQGHAAQLSGENEALRTELSRQTAVIEELRVRLGGSGLGSRRGTQSGGGADQSARARRWSSRPWP